MKKNLWMLLFFVAVLYVLPMFFKPLLLPAEFRYAEIAREIIEHKNFASPKLLGFRYFDGMPASSWLTAANIALFGMNNFALRLLSFLSILGTALGLWLWCRKHLYSPEKAINAVFLYLGGCAVWFMGTFTAPDAFFCFSNIAACICFSLGIENSSSLWKRIVLLLCAGFAIACGFLTGGLPALVLFLCAMLLYLLWQKELKNLLWLLFTLLAALLFIVPWAVAVHRAEPDFWHYYITYKYTCTLTRPAIRFLPLVMLAGLLPALPVVLTGMTGAASEVWQDTLKSSGVRFAFCLTVASLLLLPFPSGNLAAVFLTVYAPAALLGALILDRVQADKLQLRLHELTVFSSVIFIIIGTLALIAGLFYLLWGTGFIPVLPLNIAVWTPFATTLALGMVFSGTLFFVNRKIKIPEPAGFFTLFALTMFMALWFMPGYTASHKMPEYELLEIAGRLSKDNIKRPKIVTTTELMYPVAWCFRDSTVQLLGGPGEMRYGHKYALACGERPLALSKREIKFIL